MNLSFIRIFFYHIMYVNEKSRSDEKEIDYETVIRN